MTDPRADAVYQYVRQRYSPAEFPALDQQRQRWSAEPPLLGLSVLDATPVFANTTAKYAALLAGGARLTVSPGPGIPSDDRVVDLLPDWGIRVADAAALDEEYDVVLDCAGTHERVHSRLGVVELTGSGRAVYADHDRPVLLADAGRVKRIETTLGTGDGFQRAMTRLGHPLSDRALVVFGAGKVGRGITRAALQSGARVTVVDRVRPEPPGGADWVDPRDREQVTAAISSAWCVVTATGVRHALAPLAAELCAGGALLANMGAEDEFGPGVPAARALNGKQPLNFVLAEPTRLRYLEPTLALSNAAAVRLRAGGLPPGISPPPDALEAQILDDVCSHGAIADELCALIREGEL